MGLISIGQAKDGFTFEDGEMCQLFLSNGCTIKYSKEKC